MPYWSSSSVALNIGTLAPVTGAQLNDSRQVLLTAFVAGPNSFGTILYLAGLAGGT